MKNEIELLWVVYDFETNCEIGRTPKFDITQIHDEEINKIRRSYMKETDNAGCALVNIKRNDFLNGEFISVKSSNYKTQKALCEFYKLEFILMALNESALNNNMTIDNIVDLALQYGRVIHLNRDDVIQILKNRFADIIES